MVTVKGPGAAAAVSRAPTTILHVSPAGSDANSGRSWYEAKLTILAAYDALPSSGGTILLDGNPVAMGGVGLWLVGPIDPHFASPLTGWRVQKPLHLIGVGHGTFGGIGGGPMVRISTTDTTGPVIWLSGLDRPMHVENVQIQYPSVAIRLGVASDLSRRDTYCSGLEFVNVEAKINNSENVPLKGPTVDIGYVFWTHFRRCNFSGNPSAALDSDLRAAILADPGGAAASPSFHIEDTNFSQGGLRYRRGPSGWGFAMRRCVLEGDFVNPVPPLVDILNGDRYGRVVLEDLYTADAPGSAATVRVNATCPVDVVIATAVAGISGPATVLSRAADGWPQQTITPAGLGQTGFWAGRVAGQHDAARRGFGPVAVRWPNLANGNPASWGVGAETGIVAPDGTTDAGRVTADLQIYRAGITLAVGDWLLAGVWMRASSGTPGAELGVAASGAIFDNGLPYRLIPPPLLGDGEWEWVAIAVKIATGTSTELILTLHGSVGQPTDYYAPIVFRVPTGTVSDSEAREVAQQLQSYPSGATAGDVALRPGQKLYLGGRPIFATGASHTVDELVTALQTLGLVRQS